MSLTGNLAENYGSSQAVLALLHKMRPFMVLQSDHDYVRNTFYIAVGHVHVANNDSHFDHLISRILSGQVLWHSYRQNSTSQCLEVALSNPPTFYNSSQIQMAGPVNQGTDNVGQVHQDTQTTNSCVQDNTNAQDSTNAHDNSQSSPIPAQSQCATYIAGKRAWDQLTTVKHVTEFTRADWNYVYDAMDERYQREKSASEEEYYLQKARRAARDFLPSVSEF